MEPPGEVYQWPNLHGLLGAGEHPTWVVIRLFSKICIVFQLKYELENSRKRMITKLENSDDKNHFKQGDCLKLELENAPSRWEGLL